MGQSDSKAGSAVALSQFSSEAQRRLLGWSRWVVALVLSAPCLEPLPIQLASSSLPFMYRDNPSPYSAQQQPTRCRSDESVRAQRNACLGRASDLISRDQACERFCRGVRLSERVFLTSSNALRRGLCQQRCTQGFRP